MHGSLQKRVAEAREIEGRIVSGADKIVQPPKWTEWARICWPDKTDVELALVAKRDPRTARRWLSGEFEPPQAVWAALIGKLLEH